MHVCLHTKYLACYTRTEGWSFEVNTNCIKKKLYVTVC